VALQQQQFNSVLTQGVKVIVLDPVDSSAAAALVTLAQSQGVKVIAYDRPIPDVPADYYVSFDNQGIGQAIAQSLVDHLKASGGAVAAFKAAGVDPVPPVTGSGGQRRDGLPEGRNARAEDHALQHAVGTLRPGRGDGREHQGRDLRQGHQYTQRSLHRRVC
jgi:D-xylose transport system substrate-binding protein